MVVKKQIEKQHGTPSGQMQVFIKRAYQYIPISAELTTLESVESLSDNENKDRNVVLKIINNSTNPERYFITL